MAPSIFCKKTMFFYKWPGIKYGHKAALGLYGQVLIRNAGISCFFILSLFSCKNASNIEYSVMQGEFIQSVTESGELQAIDASYINMPKFDYRYAYSYKIIGILEYGQKVETGDSVVALDPAPVYKGIIRQEEALENARVKLDKQKVESEIKRRDLEVKYKNQEASFELKKLELERMQFESGQKKRIKELEFKKAKLALEKVRRKLELYPLLDKHNRRISELEVMQIQADIQNLHEVLSKLVLRSPGNGYFIIDHNRRAGHNFVLGDEVYMGAMIASIPDISSMKAESFINETDISRVKEGTKVNIRLNALPGITFDAVVKNISKICKEDNKQKIFDTQIVIHDNDERLKPGMSVSCEYICYKSDNELYVPNECLLSEGNKVYVFVKQGNKTKKTEVITGPSNARYTIIHTKIKPGRALILPEQVIDI